MRAIGDMLNDAAKAAAAKNGQDFSAESFEKMKKQVFADPDVRAFLTAHQDQLTKESVDASFASLYEYCRQKDSHDKVISGYLPQLFMEGPLIGIRYQASQDKQRRDKEAAAKRRIELIDLPEKLRRVKLADLDMADDRKQALFEVGAFLQAYQSNPHAKGLYLSGDFGVGKTYILAGLANRVAEMGGRVIFLHMPTFIAGLSSHFGDNSLQTEIQRLAVCDVLILDDIGAETLSPWSRDDVLGVILQARMDNDLPTFFSSNFDMKTLESHFSATKNADDPVKAARLMQRVRYLAKEVVVYGNNRRLP
ncbi:primosomal protein DnaI [Lactobacillus delbrueckii subsp. delbrueckii DSM 20074 = JCM 1012]|uniref:primosomal protein DnaI n=1 Tax=Lactobacillus delbrueckii TaxID=1584 RepID=UPI00046F0746|nr:primosomal protein DnaI [Lactobacillus delbrueckii]APP10010.1 primosomal protein DnaI [Lactobacillus delbrueckii subsp. delbrueckii DSM 20074 = JCM 1012]KNZ37804.1 primosomal protein DnaI [Lactobacillus delbrueckii subsp. delbrueckii]KRK23443.1 primosomal protein DnaI [Lactobacillus delbrueckii subsp. delbrueckii DSM 20074 = JCM 1012]MCT3492805.1 primosomal protein DnaI [Lactobacillus delbrueckii]MCT3521648.1 primosomal protein DnaI [Lactobacillus delbrueckii]